MNNWWKHIATKYPWRVITTAVVLAGGMALYSAGIFGEIKTSEQFTANGTESMRAKTLLEEKFGAVPSTDIILFERVDQALGTADSELYQAEVARLIAPLKDKVGSVTTYATQPSAGLISRDKTMTYAAVQSTGTEAEAYKTLSDFANSADQTKLKVTIGGQSVIAQQMNSTVSRDLLRAELITFPVLLVLLLVFFRSVIAALVPLIISLVTIVGALAIARLVNHVMTVDHYAVNVITILGIGLAIDYALLSVNRFREELKKGSAARAVRTVIDTSGRTIFFSGITVIACMLSLLVFPLDILHSIAIGSASAVIVAMAFTVMVLPAILMVLGKRIDAWRVPFLKEHKGESRFWNSVAQKTTKHPIWAASIALAVIAVTCIPLSQFKLAGGMDYRYVANNSSGRYVAQKLQEEFTAGAPSLVAIQTLPADTSLAERTQLACDTTKTLQAIPHVTMVLSAAPLAPGMNCEVLILLQQQNTLPAPLKTIIQDAARSDALKFSIVLDVPTGSAEAASALRAVRGIPPTKGEWLVGGLEAYAYDTNKMYFDNIPRALLVIVISMLVLLSLLLASVAIPVQAIIINSVSLAISFAVIIAVFQLGAIDQLTKWGTTDGIVMTPLVLIAAIAFGLAMDYSVFLYSRMFEVHQKTADNIKAIQQGVIKTGPIISAAALMVFVVVAAFAGSSVTFMRIVGVGLGVAVLVDAFFVRLLLVPAVMTLMGKASWHAPKWLKRLQIRHE